jgi:hypothetical protein
MPDKLEVTIDTNVALTVVAVVGFAVGTYLIVDGLIGLYRLNKRTKIDVVVIDSEGNYQTIKKGIPA